MFVRSWLRAVFSAGGIVLMVPLGLVLAVALSAAVGGASLTGLGQVLGGPQVPGPEAGDPGVVRVAQADGGDVPAIPARASGRSVASGGRRAARPAPAARRSTRREGGGGAGPPAAGAPAVRPPATPPASLPAVPGEAPAATPPPASPTPPPARNPVRELTETVDRTVRPILPPVGPTAADAIGTVVDLLVPPPQ
ncbi:MAG: hypothetical protein AVDCRST_MAG53-2377 [uncultured Solirubrobacteraceae bacterium]|uniref:Uncharacterized protein n=1 Tax=uncultured Solirubrobacteraceae bacterium TaxID=1162706 RepID=A0A6J4SU80_9ACTN|nr:MAG: hypothetical protein AVDCRST_MAG53-2377 [uncultured Solirubrobacteraceae bacterium]